MEILIFPNALSLFMETGFDIMEYDKALKTLWLKRIGADAVDFGITLALAVFIGLYLIHFDWISILFLLQGPIWFVYSSVLDCVGGKTVGKYLFKIKSVAFIGDLRGYQCIARNATKLNFILFIADIIAGLSTEGDPRQRYTERIVDSLVVSEHKWDRKTESVEMEKREESEEREEELELPS